MTTINEQPEDQIIEYTCHICESTSIIGIEYGDIAANKTSARFRYGMAGLQQGQTPTYHHCPACDEQAEDGNCSIKEIRRY